MNQDEIKNAIADQLSSSQPDWQLIERLSRDIVDADLGNVRFTVPVLPPQKSDCASTSWQADLNQQILRFNFDISAGTHSIATCDHRDPNDLAKSEI